MSRSIAWTVACPAVALVAFCSAASAGEPTGACCSNWGTPNGVCTENLTEAECNAMPPLHYWRPGQPCSPEYGCYTCLFGADQLCADANMCSYDYCSLATGLCEHDFDIDNDAVQNCDDGCPSNANLVQPLPCGCQTPPPDQDHDGTCDALDACPSDGSNQCVPQAPAVSTWGAIAIVLSLGLGVAAKSRHSGR